LDRINKIYRVYRECIANGMMGVPFIRNWRVRRGRTMSDNTNDQVQNVLGQFDFFIRSIGWENVRDKTVIEIGPGDAIPHGLLFLGAGAKKYIAVDRFSGNVSSVSAEHLYRALIESAPKRLCQGWHERGLHPHQYPWLEAANSSPRIKLVTKSIEEVDLEESEQADIIVSFNVIEHLSNVTQAFERMAKCLNPSGLMAHRVDYGPHGYAWKNPLEFLTLSNTVWGLMGSNRGWPNRLRHSQDIAGFREQWFQ